MSVWTAYAVVEFALYTLYPLYARPGLVVTPLAWREQTLLLDCFWGVGILGGIAGAVLAAALSRRNANAEDGARLGASLSLLAVAAYNLGVDFSPGPSVEIVVATNLSLIAAMSYALRNPGWRLAKWTYVHPLLLAWLLVGPIWLAKEILPDQSSQVKLLAVVGTTVIGIGIHAVAARRPRRGHGAHFAAGLALMSLVVFVAAARSGAHQVLPRLTPAAVPVPPRTPVVLVSLDTTRADHLSVYGYASKTTPQLEKFAGEATLFTDALSATDMTLGSHASMFTGVYASWHGAHYRTVNPRTIDGLDGKLPTMAGILAEKGYVTAAVSANTSYLTRNWGLNRGFQLYRVPEGLGNAESRRYTLRQAMRPLMCLAMPAKDFDTTFRRAGEVNDDVFRLLDLNSQHPLFLFVNYMDAHSPYLAPLHLQDKFRVGPTLGLDGLNDTMLQAARDNGRDFPELLQLRAQYDAGIAAEDEAFGALMQRLKARGIYDEALIIVTGDHGETFGQRGLMVHGTSVYADQTHVPLAIKYPRQKTPAVVTQSVSHVDLLPTVMDTLGYPAPAHVQGQSLRAVAGLAADRAVFTESFPTTDFPGGDRTDRAIRYGSMKLILSTTGRLELYDLARDPAERNNLYSFDNPHVAVLEPLLRQWIRQIPKADKKATPADEKELLRLKSLGYTQ